jgi:uncharacterized SAM-binding protein YcdF (DUF218 family)
MNIFEDKNAKAKRHAWGSALIILGILSIIFFFFNYIPNRRLGGAVDFAILFPLVAGIILIFVGIFGFLIKRNFIGSKARVIKRSLLTAFILLLIFFLAVEGLIIKSAVTTDQKQADYLVILGAGLANGDQISPILYDRLNKGLDYMKKHPVIKVILSGGQGSNETISEAEGMRRFLVGHGVKEGRVLKEERSRNTFENLKFTKELIEKTYKKEPSKIIIITSDFHEFRAKFLANRIGLTAYGIPSPTPWTLIPNYYVREFFAVVKSFLLDRK